MQRSETVAEAIERATAQRNVAIRNGDVRGAQKAQHELDHLAARKDKTELVRHRVR